jgi:DNA polymerase-3 subunit gamma/tau
VKPILENKPYTREELQKAWDEFAETKKTYQADYQLLTQGFDHNNDEIIIRLYSIQETIFNNIRADLTTFIREKLQNFAITINGELIEGETKKMIYTNREKLEHLMEKNPVLKELKERLGLDTDF